MRLPVTTATGGALGLFSFPGALIAFVALGLFVSCLLAMRRVIAIKQQRFRSLFFQSPDAIFEFSKDGRYVLLNSHAKAIAGIADRDLGMLGYQGLRSAKAMSKSDYLVFDAAFKKTIEGSAQTVTVKLLNIDHEWRDYECSFVPILINDVVAGLYALVKDVTEQLVAQENQRAIMKSLSEKKAQESQLAYQATHDMLTGLANRALFEDRLEHDIELTRRNGEQLAVMFIDLDAFKPINDTLGHRVGDQVLISVARRMRDVLRPTDTLARFGGDEFVLLLPNLETPQQAEVVADRILSEIGQAHRVGPHELYVTASIGISFLPEHLDAPAKMIQQADMAMYKAKRQGRDTFFAYSEDLDKKLSKRVTLRNELQEAIKHGQLFLKYQPQVDQNGALCGLEALVRWKHPVKGFIPPADFIPIAEETGQIMQLGRWVITQACADARTLLDRGMLQSRMAVNLSPLQFHRPGFLTALREILDLTSLPPRYLELELTEGILMRNSDAAIEILRALKQMGVTTTIDDFGTGYSSFSYLKDLPVESVKIDKSFVDNVITNAKDAAFCKGIITMAGEMGMTVFAEGIESCEQFELLASYGCELFQGFYFARPMPFAELIDWMQQRQA